MKKTGLIETLHRGSYQHCFIPTLLRIDGSTRYRKEIDQSAPWETLCTVLFGWFYWSLSCGQWRGSYRPCGSSFRYVLCCWVDNPRVYSPVSYVAMLRFIEYLTVPSDLAIHKKCSHSKRVSVLWCKSISSLKNLW